MRSVRLICWNEALVPERTRILKKTGFRVDASPLKMDHFITRFRAAAPQAVVIDLDRLPSHGLGVATLLRRGKSTRHIPIIFAGGAKDKVDRIRKELPDACFTDWVSVARSLQEALKNPPPNPVKPPPPLQRYEGTSLVKKLGFKSGMHAALFGPPDGFDEQLGEVPDGVKLETKMTRETSMVLWFVRSLGELQHETAYLAARLPDAASIWIIYPKQASRHRVDFNLNDVRRVALAAGLVDYKVCAVDADWTGLKFARKRSPAR